MIISWIEIIVLVRMVRLSLRMNEDKKRHLENKLQAICFTILVILFIFVMGGVKRLQGTARVINFTGMIRGGSQRLVKLEMAGRPQPELVEELDKILEGLSNGGGEYELVKLDHYIYDIRLNELNKYWATLKSEIVTVREKGWENTNIINVSEKFFELADKTVDAAEDYSQKRVNHLIRLQLAIIIIIMMIMTIIFKRLSKSFNTLKQNHKLHEQAYFDVLTNIYNRRFFDEFMMKLEHEKKDYTLCYMDLDRLKYVNDHFGHSKGDEYIQLFVETVKQEFRNEDIFCRLGGDEFCLILLGCSSRLAEQKLEILRKRFIECEANKYEGSFSFGVIGIDGVFNQLTISQILHTVDEKMYQYKMTHRCQREEVIKEKKAD